MIKNNGPVLVPDVGTLPIQSGRIVIRPENLEQMIVADNSWIELDLHHFRVAGGVAANIFVGRILGLAAGITDGCIGHTGDGAEGRFNPPKTSGTECRFFRGHAFTMKRTVMLRNCMSSRGWRQRAEGPLTRSTASALQHAYSANVGWIL